MNKLSIFLVGLAIVLMMATACSSTTEPSIVLLPSWSEGQAFRTGETITVRWQSANSKKEMVRISLYQDQGSTLVMEDVFPQEDGSSNYMVTMEDTGSYAWIVPPSLAPGEEYTLQVFIPPYPTVIRSPSFVVK